MKAQPLELMSPWVRGSRLPQSRLWRSSWALRRLDSGPAQYISSGASSGKQEVLQEPQHPCIKRACEAAANEGGAR